MLSQDSPQWRFNTRALGARPHQVHVQDEQGRAIACFTPGAHTVVLTGPPRRFIERKHVVLVDRWVRTYPQPFDPNCLDVCWLGEALAANARGQADILAIAFQYVSTAGPIYDAEDPTLQIAGDAQYGPLRNGTREEGSDFNDYLGVTWPYPDEPTDKPEAKQFRCLDCSGFVRMIYGYRCNLDDPRWAGHVALCREPSATRAAIPRRARHMADSAPGVEVIARTRTPNPALLAPGDLVFFDADPGDGAAIDHVGVYLGRDTLGHHRFISSRKRANGPTMGDIGGRSILDGDGTYARSFRSARRL